MILPNGNNKKYAEVVSGLYILYVILNPILNIDNSFAVSNVKETINQISDESYVSQEEVARTYILSLANNLKEKIENEGYDVEYIQFYITQDYTNIAKIEVKMKYGTNFEEDKIRQIILENFNLDSKNIMVF